MKLKSHVLYDPVVPLLGIYMCEMKTHIYTKTCTHMFIAILLKRAQTWKKTQMSINWLMDEQCHMSVTKNIQQTKTAQVFINKRMDLFQDVNF